jgi:hypothetical protein
LQGVMIRPDILLAIKAGDVDLAFRRWERPRVKVGTRLRTRVGVVEVTSVEQVAPSRITAALARRSGASLAELRELLALKADMPVWQIGVRYAGADPRAELRSVIPDAQEIGRILARLDRLDAASPIGAWTLPRSPSSMTGRPCAPLSWRPRSAGTPPASSATCASSRSWA